MELWNYSPDHRRRLRKKEDLKKEYLEALEDLEYYRILEESDTPYHCTKPPVLFTKSIEQQKKELQERYDSGELKRLKHPKDLSCSEKVTMLIPKMGELKELENCKIDVFAGEKDLTFIEKIKKVYKSFIK